MTDSTPAEVVSGMNELYNDGSPDYYGSDRFLEMFAEDVACEFLASADSPARRVVGREPFREVSAGAASMFRNRHNTVDVTLAAGDKVVTRYTWSATAAADMPGIPAGATVRADGADFHTVKDGPIVAYTNLMGPTLVDDGK